MENGDVKTAGETGSGGNLPVIENVRTIYSNEKAFAALKTDGSLFVWGNKLSGGDPSYSEDCNSDGACKITGGQSVVEKLTSDVVSVFATYDAFAAIKTGE